MGPIFGGGLDPMQLQMQIQKAAQQLEMQNRQQIARDRNAHANLRQGDEVVPPKEDAARGSAKNAFVQPSANRTISGGQAQQPQMPPMTLAPGAATNTFPGVKIGSKQFSKPKAPYDLLIQQQKDQYLQDDDDWDKYLRDLTVSQGNRNDILEMLQGLIDSLGGLFGGMGGMFGGGMNINHMQDGKRIGGGSITPPQRPSPEPAPPTPPPFPGPINY